MWMKGKKQNFLFLGLLVISILVIQVVLPLKRDLNGRGEYTLPEQFEFPEDYAILTGGIYNNDNRHKLILNWPKQHVEEFPVEDFEVSCWSGRCGNSGEYYYKGRTEYGYDSIRKMHKGNKVEIVRGDFWPDFSISPNQKYLGYVEKIQDDQNVIQIYNLGNGSKHTIPGVLFYSVPTWISNEIIAYVELRGIVLYDLQNKSSELIAKGEYSSVVYWRDNVLLVAEDDDVIFTLDLQSKNKEYFFHDGSICGPAAISPCRKYAAFSYKLPEDFFQRSKHNYKPHNGATVCIVNLETMEYTFYSRPNINNYYFYSLFVSWTHISYEDYVNKPFED